MRLRLEGHAFSLSLLTFGGAQVASGEGEAERTVGPGHYVAAVRAPFGQAGGSYRLTLVIRQVTTTTISTSSAELSLGSSVTFGIGISPRPDGGVVEVEIDRYDTLAGWHYHHRIRIHAGSGFSWAPPGAGRWRVRASFLGTIQYSPSHSGYGTILVT